MASLGNYSGSELVEGTSEFDPIPEGIYDAEVTASDVVVKDDGQRVRLSIELTVRTDGYDGRKVWHGFNLKNPSPKAEEIAQRELSDLCRACGMAAVPGESEEFHGIPIRIKVGMGKPNPPYAAKSEVKKFLSSGEDAPTQQPARQQQVAPRTGGVSGQVSGRPAPAWKKAG